MSAFGDFLEEQRRERGLTGREFARLLHIQHSTLIGFISQEHVPSMNTLLKVSGSLSFDLLTLIAIAFPDKVRHASTESMKLAQAIGNLPESARAFIKGLIASGLLESHDAVGNESQIASTKSGKAGRKKKS